MLSLTFCVPLRQAAYAFDAGAKEIVLVSTAKEAFRMYHQDNSLILMGEQEGRPISGFHYGNSPDEIQKSCLLGHKIVQRTSAGTQGVVNCGHANQLMIASFVVAEATLGNPCNRMVIYLSLYCSSSYSSIPSLKMLKSK